MKLFKNSQIIAYFTIGKNQYSLRNSANIIIQTMRLILYINYLTESSKQNKKSTQAMAQNCSQSLFKYSLKNGNSYFLNCFQEVFKKKLKNTKPQSTSNYSVFNLIKVQKEQPKLGYGLLAKQLESNFIKKQTQLEKKQESQLVLYTDYQKTQAIKVKFMKHMLNQVKFPSTSSQKQENYQLVKFKKQLHDKFVYEVQTVLNVNQIIEKKIKTKGKQVQLLNLKFACFASQILSNFDKTDQVCEYQTWVRNIKQLHEFDREEDHKPEISISIFLQTTNKNIQNLLLDSIPFQTLSKPNLKISKIWTTNFIQRQQLKFIRKRITGKMLYSIEQKGKQIAQNKLKIKHFKKQKKLSLSCLKNNFCRGLGKPQRQNSYQHEANINVNIKNKQVKLYERPLNVEKVQTSQDSSYLSQNSANFKRYHKEKKQSKLNSFIQKNQRMARRLPDSNKHNTQRCKQYHSISINNGGNLLYNIKNRSKRSPISIAALNQFNSSKNAKLGIFNGNELKKNAFFHKPSSKSLPKNNHQTLAKFNNNQAQGPKKQTKQFYPLYVGSLKIINENQSYLQYESQKQQVKSFTVKFLVDRIKTQENNVVIIIPTILDRQVQEKLKKLVKIVVSLGGKLRLKHQDPYRRKNRQQELQLMIYQHLTKVHSRQIIKILHLQKQRKNQTNTQQSKKTSQ